MKLLFVCTGNICRSVLAEYIAKKYAAQKKLEGLEIASAGVDAQPQYRIYGNLAVYMQALGIDTEAYRNTQITREMIDSYDYIFVMERFHVEKISAIRENNKTHLIKEFAGGEGEITDPIYETSPDYSKLYSILEHNIIISMDKILNGKEKSR